MTKEEAQALFIESIELLKSLNIPLGKHIDTTLRFKVRMSTAYGRCHYDKRPDAKKYSEDEFTCWIELNENFALNGSYKGIRNTIIHELLHTINPRAGHRGEWKYYAGVVNEKLGTDIKRCCGDKTAEDRATLRANTTARKTPSKIYRIQCPTCGRSWDYTRYSSVVKDTKAGHRYCSHCLNEFKLYGRYKQYDERSRLVVVEA